MRASVASIAAAVSGSASVPWSVWNTTIAWVPAWAGNVSCRRSRACWASVPGTSNLSSRPAPATRPSTTRATTAAIHAREHEPAAAGPSARPRR